MDEVKIGEVSYGIGRLNARQQFHVVRRLAPLLSAFGSVSQMLTEAKANPYSLLVPLANTISAMPDAEADYVLNTCLSVVERGKGTVVKFVDGQALLMFEDLQLPDMVKLVFEVLRENLGGFFAALPAPPSGPGAAAQSSSS